MSAELNNKDLSMHSSSQNLKILLKTIEVGYDSKYLESATNFIFNEIFQQCYRDILSLLFVKECKILF